MRLNRRQREESPYVPLPGTTLLSVVEQLRRVAARQREIAGKLPRGPLRERFRASADSLERQALAEERAVRFPQ